MKLMPMLKALNSFYLLHTLLYTSNLHRHILGEHVKVLFNV